MAGSSTKVVLIAFTMNFSIAIAKFIGFFFTGSAAMFAEGVHSIADTSNQVFLFLGIKRSRRKATEKHPFGYGMEQYIWAFIVAIIIFALGGIFSAYEGIHKLLEPGEHLDHVGWSIGILCLAILLEGYSSFIATKEVKKRKGKLSMFGFAKSSKDQILVTVLFEDYAALLGLSIALIGLVCYQITGLIIFDSLASVFIGVLLCVIAVFLYREAMSLLVGESASPEDLAKIKKVFEKHPKVKALKELLTMHLSSDQILVNAHVKFEDGLLVEEVEDIIDEIELQIAGAVPEVFKIFIETHQKEKVIPVQLRKKANEH